METVAMYWEPQIKTYGFQVKKNLALYEYALSADLSAQWGRFVGSVEDSRNRFHLLCAQMNASGGLELLLLCDPKLGASLACDIETEMPQSTGCRCRVTAPVELLFFQGPHYGDRYGIVDFMLQALGDNAESILATACSCASVYLVLSNGCAEKIRAVLAEAFSIPG